MAFSPDLDEAPARFADLVRVRAFRVLFVAEIQSLLGDQLARVALATLVYQRTNSVAATSLTYALTYLPGVLGGLVLARIGDRLPRAPVMVGADLARVVLFVLMAMPGMPIPVMVCMVAVATFIEPAFSAAQFAYLAKILSPSLLRTATGLRMATIQAAQVAGFALGGLAVATIGARQALQIDALSFALSALLVAVGLRVHTLTGWASDAGQERAADGSPSGERQGTIQWILGRPGVTRLIALSCLVGLFVVPEGLAVPYAAAADGSAAAAGVLLASMPLGGTIGAVVLARWVPARRRAPTTWAMVLGCGLPLVVTAWDVALPVVFAAWLVSGACAAYQVEVIAQLARRVPDERRSGVMGVVGGCLLASQGLCIAVFGLVGQWLGPGDAVAVAGVLGAGLAAVFWLMRGAKRNASASSGFDAGGFDVSPAIHAEIASATLSNQYR